MRGKPVVNKWQNHGKLAANTRLMLAVICPENLAAKFHKYLQQCRDKGCGKNSTGRGKLAAKCRGKLTAKIRGKLKCRFPRLCHEFAANLAFTNHFSRQTYQYLMVVSTRTRKE
jgi:hypothetical protein